MNIWLKIWLKGLEWDEEELDVKFKTWFAEINELKNISADRKYFLESTEYND